VLVECGVEPQAADEGDRFGEIAAAIKEFEGSVAAIGDGHDLPARAPAPY
jgi:hypothetical protein